MTPPRFPSMHAPSPRSVRRTAAWCAAVALLLVSAGAPRAQGPVTTVPAQRYAFQLPNTGAIGGQPIVVDLDRNGEPEILYLAGNGATTRRLVAVHGGTGTVAFSLDAFQPNAPIPVVLGDPYSELAAGDLDGDGYAEIVAVDGYDGTPSDPFRQQLVAIRPSGLPWWISDDVVSDPLIDTTSGLTRPVIADLDADGVPEIVVGYGGRGPLTPQNVSSEDYVTVFDHLGHIRWTARGGGTNQGGSPSTGGPVVVDLDLDGTPEILYSDDVFSAQGTWLRSVNNVLLRVADVSVANFNDDPYPEIVYTDGSGNLWLYDHTGARLWGSVTPPGAQGGLGMPAIGDVTGDGIPEIVVVRYQSIEVLTGAGAPLFSVPLAQVGDGGNVTLFDLDGDTRAEIVYHSSRGPFDSGIDRGALVIVDGQTRAQRVIYARRNGGDDQRGPIVADVNGDGSAEIVAKGYNDTVGFRVFGAQGGAWAQTRPIWNQFGFHVTHVRSTGTVPARPPINWLTPGLNSFRANGFPELTQGLAPVAAADTYSTSAGTAVVIAAPGVLGNDTANGMAPRAALVGLPAHGTVTLSGSGSFQYTPANGYTGTDTWTYRPVTGNGAGAVATVTMTVTGASVAVPPTNFRVVGVSGNTVSLAWTPPAAGPAPTGYQLEGGLAPGQVIGALPLGTTPSVTLSLPTGAFYLRLRTVAGASTSAASNEVQAFVNVPVAPAAPVGLLGLVVGNAVTLTWQNSLTAGTPTGLVLDVSGALSASLPLGVSEGFSFPSVPPGTYTFAVRATNAAGASGPSNTVTLTFPTACSGVPQVPTAFAASVTGSVIALGWNPPVAGPAPTSYLLQVSGAYVGALPITARALSAPVPPGSYTLRVAAVNPCGTGPSTVATTVTVP